MRAGTGAQGAFCSPIVLALLTHSCDRARTVAAAGAIQLRSGLPSGQGSLLYCPNLCISESILCLPVSRIYGILKTWGYWGLAESII